MRIILNGQSAEQLIAEGWYTELCAWFRDNGLVAVHLNDPVGVDEERRVVVFSESVEAGVVRREVPLLVDPPAHWPVG